MQRNLEFGVNLDVTTYMDGTRETHNPPGIAYAPVVWDFYQVCTCTPAYCDMECISPNASMSPLVDNHNTVHDIIMYRTLRMKETDSRSVL